MSISTLNPFSLAISSVKSTGKPCGNLSSVIDDKGNYLCRVHSKKISTSDIPKQELTMMRRNYQNMRYQKYKSTLIFDENESGKVKVNKLRMRKWVSYQNGYLMIFPNYRHGNRKDGIGMPELSPMNLGPIKHNFSDINNGICQNLENLWQGLKVYKQEMINDKEINFTAFNDNLRMMFRSNKGFRHKYTRKDKPLFMYWKNTKGKVFHLGYVESRQIYCRYYHDLAIKTKEYQKLVKMLSIGINITITGYDASNEESPSVNTAYLDSSRPFGHEMMLYTMLTTSKKKYPWLIDKNINAELFE